MADIGEGSVQPFDIHEGTIFDGYKWRSGIREKHFPNIQHEFHIPETIVLEVASSGCCDDEGFAGKVAITIPLLSHGLRLSFCHPLHDILELLDLAPAQLHPFALRVYLCAYIIFCMALEPLGDPYPNLTA